MAQFPTRVHAQGSARQTPSPSRLFAGDQGPRAAHRLLQLSGIASTTTIFQTSPWVAAANRRAERDQVPFRAPAYQALQLRGCASHEGPCNSRVGVRTPSRIFPNLSRPEHHMSHANMPRCLDNGGEARPCGGTEARASVKPGLTPRFASCTAPFSPFRVIAWPEGHASNGLSCLGCRIRRSDEPLGPPSSVARESLAGRPHPRCLPLPSPPHARPLDAHRAFGFRLVRSYLRVFEARGKEVPNAAWSPCTASDLPRHLLSPGPT